MQQELEQGLTEVSVYWTTVESVTDGPIQIRVDGVKFGGAVELRLHCTRCHGITTVLQMGDDMHADPVLIAVLKLACRIKVRTIRAEWQKLSNPGSLISTEVLHKERCPLLDSSVLDFDFAQSAPRDGTFDRFCLRTLL